MGKRKTGNVRSAEQRTLAARDALEARPERAIPLRDSVQRAHSLSEALRAQVADDERARLVLPVETARVVLLQLLRARLCERQRQRTRRRRRLRAASRRAHTRTGAGTRNARSGAGGHTRRDAREVRRESTSQRKVLDHVAHSAAPIL